MIQTNVPMVVVFQHLSFPYLILPLIIFFPLWLPSSRLSLFYSRAHFALSASPHLSLRLRSSFILAFFHHLFFLSLAHRPKGGEIWCHTLWWVLTQRQKSLSCHFASDYSNSDLWRFFFSLLMLFFFLESLLFVVSLNSNITAWYPAAEHKTSLFCFCVCIAMQVFKRALDTNRALIERRLNVQPDWTFSRWSVATWSCENSWILI